MDDPVIHTQRKHRATWSPGVPVRTPVDDYFSDLLTELKVVLSAVPTPFTAAMMAMAIPVGNQAVFDGGCAGSILQKLNGKSLHV